MTKLTMVEAMSQGDATTIFYKWFAKYNMLIWPWLPPKSTVPSLMILSRCAMRDRWVEFRCKALAAADEFGIVRTEELRDQ